VARPLGIAVHDHIIVGKDGHASLKAPVSKHLPPAAAGPAMTSVHRDTR
jgi:hypothetical protein